MSDENTKNQDSKLDENPEKDTEPGSEQSSDSASEQDTANQTKSDEELLFDVDSILNEEEPDFLNQLNHIKIESEAVDLSIMSQILGNDNSLNSNLANFIKRPFEFTTNTRSVLIFWIFFIFAVVAGKIVWDRKESILQQSLFLNSFAELGAEIKDFNPNNEVEPFYDNLRFSKNLISISPMHVNLRSSENSGNNPMLAIEVTVEGLSADAIIEVKDREAEFKDMLLRHTEEKTYDELVEAGGKQLLCEQYRDLLNTFLTRGQVRRVLLKSFVIKP